MTVTPILRMFDEAATRDFYLGFLGFELEWEYRLEPGRPLYLSVMLGEARLHLSQHHGDCCPGGHVRILRPDLAAFQKVLAAKPYGFARPGPPERKPWGTHELTLTDPAGNRLTFVAPEV
jgi:catechol 2,3-dioxygenase-like lactoylglutathione lyase family enzyme